MASSNLTQALLGGMGGGGGMMSPMGLGMYDPAALGAMQRLGLGQSMIQEGMSSAPAYPAQALSRLGQSLIGALMMRHGFSDLQDINKQQAAEIPALDAYIHPPAAAATTPVPAAAAAPTTAGAPTAPATAAVPAAANNPLNIRFAQQPGATNTGGFAAFPTSDAGKAATDNQFGLYADRGINTLRGLISRWAPPNENNTEGYIARVAKETGIDPDAQINLKDPGVSGLIQQSMAGVEGNKNATVPTQMAQAGGAPPSAAPPATVQTGLQNPQVQGLWETIKRITEKQSAMSPYDIRGQRYLQGQLELAKQQLNIGNVVTLPDGRQVNTVTGQQTGAAAPLAHYVPTQEGSVDTSGTHPPTFKPSPRVYQTPAGAVGAVGSGGSLTTIAPADNPGVAARASASAAGTETGKQSTATANRMFDIGREADTTIGNIDYGLNQLHEAAKAGLPSGYFAPWMASAAAAGKNLGINLDALGIKPEAVQDVQTAQKTLGVVAGQILQNTIGNESQITDAKIQHFIHTQPDIAMDPNALDRILNWARSQFVYNRGMAMDAMRNVDPTTGILPPGWRSSYVVKNGAFAPIYDPLGGEMKQPEGEGPAPEAPKAATPAAQAAPPPQPSRDEIEAEMRKRGLLK